MTLTGRNTTIRTLLSVTLLAAVAVVVLFVRAVVGAGGGDLAALPLPQIFAIAGAIVTVLLGFFFGALYSRLFRRSPSIPVFFVTLYFLSLTLDITKIAQIVALFSRWPHLSPMIARVSIFGHIAGIFAIFAAGLYSGGVRMQRHGTVIFAGSVIAFSLSWLIPIDTSSLPDYLVYPAGIRASLEAALVVILALGVVNFVQAAITNENPRLFLTAGAVVAIAVGREILFYFVEPIWILLGGALIITGGTLFAGHHYRDFLVS